MDRPGQTHRLLKHGVWALPLLPSFPIVRLFVPYALLAVVLVRHGMEKHKAAEQKRKEQEAAPAVGPLPQ
jgi:hypothetical protein